MTVLAVYLVGAALWLALTWTYPYGILQMCTPIWFIAAPYFLVLIVYEWVTE